MKATVKRITEMLDQHSNPKKLSPPGGQFITLSSLNLLSGFKVEGEGTRRGLVEAAQMSYVSLFHPSEVTDSWVTLGLASNTGAFLAQVAEFGSLEEDRGSC